MAANETLSIKFEARGAKGLQNAINGIRVATLGLTQSQKKYEHALKGLTQQQKKAVDGMFAIQTSTRNTGNAFSVLRSKMLLVSFAFLIVGRSFGALIKAASDMEEMMNKANVVFGQQSKIVQEWAEVFGNSVGRATSEIVSMASSLQDTFVPLGFTREAATELSIGLTKLAFDVASFNNQLDTDVAKNFQSAIVGNHETVRKYGIIITESRLKLEALSLGLIKGNQQLTAQQKVLARLSLITKGSSDAIGDLERTQGSFENQTKAIKAELLETAQAFGNLFKGILQVDLAFGMANTSIMDFMKFVAQKEIIQGFSSALILVGGAFAVIRIQAALAAANVLSFGAAMTTVTGGAFLAIMALGALFSTIFMSISKTEESTESLESLEQAIINAADAAGLLSEGNEGYAESVSKSLVALEKKLKKLKAVTAEQKYAANLTHILTQEEKNYIREIEIENRRLADNKRVKAAINAENRKSIKFQVKEMKKLIDLSEDFILQKRQEVENIRMANEIMIASNSDIVLSNKQVLESQRTENFLGNLLKAGSGLEKAAEDYLRAMGLIKETQDMSFETEELERYEKELNDMEDGVGLLIIKFLKLKATLPDEKVWNKFTTGFTKSLDSIHSNVDVYADLMTGMVDTTKLLAGEAEGAWGNFANAVGDAFVSAAQTSIQANIDMTKSQAEVQLTVLKSQRTYDLMSRKQQIAEEKKIKDAANKDINKQFDRQKQLNMAGATMDYASAVMKISKQTGIMSAPWIAALTALWGAQMTLISSQKAPTMKYGGLVDGQPHSQGGTMINAEKGEFVVSKRAVDAIGLETLNRINSGQGGGTTNISFSGNILSKDFLEDEAIPQIKEALRRGGDIGVS